MNDNLDNQEYCNEDIILTLKDGKFYLRLQKFGLLVKGDDLSSTYKELVEKKKERINMMKELNINIPVNRPKRGSARHWARIDSEKILGFFLKTAILAVVFVVVVGIVALKLDGIMGTHISQLGSMVKRSANDLVTVPFDLFQYRLVPHYVNYIKSVKPVHVLEKALHEEAMKNPIEPERKEKIIKDLRVVVHRLKPFIAEIRPLFKDEQSNSQ